MSLRNYDAAPGNKFIRFPFFLGFRFFTGNIFNKYQLHYPHKDLCALWELLSTSPSTTKQSIHELLNVIASPRFSSPLANGGAHPPLLLASARLCGLASSADMLAIGNPYGCLSGHSSWDCYLSRRRPPSLIVKLWRGNWKLLFVNREHVAGE